MKYLIILLIGSSLFFSSCAFIALGVGLSLSSEGPNHIPPGAFGNIPYQKTDAQYADKYGSQLEENGSLTKSWYHYTVELVDDTYILKKYFPETKQMTDYYTYNSSLLITKQGVCKEWWDNGKRKLEGNFKNNMKSDQWTFYNHNGIITKSGFYRKGLQEGKWTFYNIKEKPFAIFNYSNNLKNGPFELFDASEKSIAEGVFFQGKLETVNWNTADSTQYQYLLTTPTIEGSQINQVASIESCNDFDFEKRRKECTTEALTKIIQENFEYPSFDLEKGVEGKAIIRLVVDAEGQLSEIEILRGISKTISEECQRVSEMLPKQWIPAKKDGKNVSTSYSLPIQLKIPKLNEAQILEEIEN